MSQTSDLTIFRASWINDLSRRRCSLASEVKSIYSFRQFVDAGGLMSYGTDQVDMFGKTAHYIDRILRGAEPADLPVQAPTKYETVLNLKTAKALGLSVPPGLLVAADEVNPNCQFAGSRSASRTTGPSRSSCFVIIVEVRSGVAYEGIPIARDVARVQSTAQPLSGAIQFERNV
jgi:hypothetical protein